MQNRRHAILSHLALAVAMMRPADRRPSDWRAGGALRRGTQIGDLKWAVSPRFSSKLGFGPSELGCFLRFPFKTIERDTQIAHSTKEAADLSDTLPQMLCLWEEGHVCHFHKMKPKDTRQKQPGSKKLSSQCKRVPPSRGASAFHTSFVNLQCIKVHQAMIPGAFRVMLLFWRGLRKEAAEFGAPSFPV